MSLYPQKQIFKSDYIHRTMYTNTIHGSLWVDLITVSRVNGPLIGLYDNDMIVPTSFSLDTCQHHRFTILRPFYHDSRSTTDTTNSSYKILVKNLLTQIPLPNRNELL